MKLFSSIYEKVMVWSEHRFAPRYLVGLSFIESSFFPFPPPDVMLAPMSLSQPQKAWFFAFITTIASVAGGLLGYVIGMFFYEAFSIEQVLKDVNYWDKFLLARSWFDEWGFWAVFIAGFTPVPYKLFTITAGVISMSLIPFILASLIGRGARFFLVAGLMKWGGEAMEAKLRKYVDWLGWLMVVLVVIIYFYLKNR
ncbi:MAG: DedA family protein [Gammaproteobacteria bacterium]|nr:DedA family protein [Gammaproteobacteria bacterium]